MSLMHIKYPLIVPLLTQCFAVSFCYTCGADFEHKGGKYMCKGGKGCKVWEEQNLLARALPITERAPEHSSSLYSAPLTHPIAYLNRLGDFSGDIKGTGVSNTKAEAKEEAARQVLSAIISSRDAAGATALRNQKDVGNLALCSNSRLAIMHPTIPAGKNSVEVPGLTSVPARDSRSEPTDLEGPDDAIPRRRFWKKGEWTRTQACTPLPPSPPNVIPHPTPTAPQRPPSSAPPSPLRTRVFLSTLLPAALRLGHRMLKPCGPRALRRPRPSARQRAEDVRIYARKTKDGAESTVCPLLRVSVACPIHPHRASRLAGDDGARIRGATTPPGAPARLRAQRAARTRR
ncbi:hypothetical protein C8J57DRAFT_1251230 [Mycena rebaudengoi]|nr:hypothetical protein C8J57DRAFT_1251230 [Mycena rebaudengoi]